MKNLNWTYIIVALIIGGAILGGSYLNIQFKSNYDTKSKGDGSEKSLGVQDTNVPTVTPTKTPTPTIKPAVKKVTTPTIISTPTTPVVQTASTKVPVYLPHNNTTVNCEQSSAQAIASASQNVLTQKNNYSACLETLKSTLTACMAQVDSNINQINSYCPKMYPVGSSEWKNCLDENEAARTRGYEECKTKSLSSTNCVMPDESTVNSMISSYCE